MPTLLKRVYAYLLYLVPMHAARLHCKHDRRSFPREQAGIAQVRSRKPCPCSHHVRCSSFALSPSVPHEAADLCISEHPVKHLPI
jgi:hypothetical protein